MTVLHVSVVCILLQLYAQLAVYEKFEVNFVIWKDYNKLNGRRGTISTICFHYFIKSEININKQAYLLYSRNLNLITEL
jgi:hypothetical protein